MYPPTWTSWIRKLFAAIVIFTITSLQASGQDALQDSIQTLQKQTSELKAMLEEMRAEIVRSRAETTALRQELEATRQQLAATLPRSPGLSGPSSPNQENEQSLQKLEEDQELLSAKVDEQYQTKVESASKYRVRLSGIVLMNLFSNRGTVDNIDFPSFGVPSGSFYSNGSFGGTLRQSQIGLEVLGPQIKRARVSGNVQFDFAGGFPDLPDGVTLGLPRLRTGVVRVDWPRTALVGGQDAPFFSPLSPTSVASLALPALSYSGNLWTWTPQLRLERRLDVNDNSNILLQGGILDPLTGEAADSQFLRVPQAGEASRQPAYATHLVWNHGVSGQQLTLGAGTYYSRQNWGAHRNIDAWAGTADWTVPVGRRWEWSGEFYRGRAIGGLGGGSGRSIVFSGPLTDPLSRVRGLNSIGGWTQAKFRQSDKLEWNGAFGQDTIQARDLRAFPLVPQTFLYPLAARNRSAFLNFIYRPRSDVLLSVEYRRLLTYSRTGRLWAADHINLGMGVLF